MNAAKEILKPLFDDLQDYDNKVIAGQVYNVKEVQKIVDSHKEELEKVNGKFFKTEGGGVYNYVFGLDTSCVDEIHVFNYIRLWVDEEFGELGDVFDGLIAIENLENYSAEWETEITKEEFVEKLENYFKQRREYLLSLIN